jgi:ABC-2 type transport system permease protein
VRTVAALARKEFRSYFQSPIAYIYLVVFLAFTNWFFFRGFFVMNVASMRGFFSLMPWVFLFLIPAVTMRLWAEEKKLGTMEVLMTWPVREHEAVLGKFLASFALLAVSIAFTLPLAGTVFLAGSPDPGPIVTGYLGLLFMGGAYLAIGLFASSLTENQIVAFITGVFLTFALFIVGEGFVVVASPAWLAPYLSFLGLGAHFSSIGRGVIDSRDVVYYLSIISFFLYLNVRRLENRRWSPLLVFLTAGILIAVNVIAQNVFVRADLTENRRFSVAPATRKVLEGMDDVVNVDAWFSRDLPPYLSTLRREVGDLLEEYGAYSGGNLNVRFRDPGDDPVEREKLRALGIPELQLEILEKDQFQLTTAYMGIALHYGGRTESLPVVQGTSRLEYELTSAILRLTAEEKKRIGWLGGSAPAQGEAPLQRELGRFYDVEHLSPAAPEAIGEGIDTLVLEGPRDLGDETRLAIDQFIMKGGKAVFLVDHYSLEGGGLFPAPFESGVHDMLETYGVRVNRDVVIEPVSNAQASFSSGFMQFRIPYPFWPRVGRKELSAEHPITAGLESVVIPWTSSLELVTGEGGEVRGEVLAASTPASWVESERYDFSPQRRLRLPADEGELGSRPLALLLQGRFPSFWKDRQPPPAPEGSEPMELIEKSEETSILVVGSSSMARAEFLQQFPSDAVFLMNVLDWMTFGTDLIGIRSRTGGERVLDDLPHRTRTLLKVVNTVILPALLAVYGGVRLALRRRRRHAD